jgi:alpha-galactosidase
VPEELTGLHAAVDQFAGQYRVKQQIVPLVDIRAAGLNHFTWILSIHDRRTGEDLYPLFRKRFFELDPKFEPLTRDVFSAFGWCPVPGDTHLCEYLPWVSDAQTKPWEYYNIRLYDWDMMAGIRDFGLDHLNEMANGFQTIEHLLHTDSEGALEMIENQVTATTHYHLAANVPNVGQIDNLPYGATVETPVLVDGAGFIRSMWARYPTRWRSSAEEKPWSHNLVWTPLWKAIARKHCNAFYLIPSLQISALQEKF